MNQTKTLEKSKITIMMPQILFSRVRQVVPKGAYSDFFAISAIRELERMGRKRIAALKGKINFALDWREMEELELNKPIS